MNTAIGIFAGRGDVILAMGMTGILFFWLGWKAKAFKDSIKAKFTKKQQG